MTEVRAGVDAVDDEIICLLSRRFRFMEAAARIKPIRSDVRDARRKAEVLDHVRQTAADARIPAELAVSLYDQLIEGSIAYELTWFDAIHAEDCAGTEPAGAGCPSVEMAAKSLKNNGGRGKD